MGAALEDEVLALLGEVEWPDAVPDEEVGEENEAEEQDVVFDEAFVDISAPGPPPLDQYQTMARRAGLEERDRSDTLYRIGSSATAKPIGRMQIIHGGSLSVVAICLCGHERHAASSSSSSSRPTRPKKGKADECRLLLHAMTGAPSPHPTQRANLMF